MKIDFHKWVIDPNIFISYIISRRLNEIPALIEKHNIMLCAGEALIREFTNVISREKFTNYLKESPEYYSVVLRNYMILFPIEKNFKGARDVNDDYLIDIVQQTNAHG